MKKNLITITILITTATAVNFLILSPAITEDLRLDDQEATIRAINKVMPAVVSIIVYDQAEVESYNLQTGERSVSEVRREVGNGTGFLVTADGFLITNKHVVEAADKDTGEYRIILSEGKEYYAQYIGIDPLNDLGVLKIFDKDLPYVELGDSDKLSIGTTVIAIGNSLGRYQNSATKGIVSGLGRSLVAGDTFGNFELLDNVIQTDAQIHPGNSGGPLIDLEGRVIGVNVAIDNAGSALSFAIPVNDARPVIQSVRSSGRIIRPRLGIRYVMLTPELARDEGLPRENGAWITSDDPAQPAVMPDSPAADIGLQANDIIFEINAIKLTGKTTLISIVQRYKPGDRIGLKIQRGDKVMIKEVVLDEFK